MNIEPGQIASQPMSSQPISSQPINTQGFRNMSSQALINEFKRRRLNITFGAVGTNIKIAPSTPH